MMRQPRSFTALALCVLACLFAAGPCHALFAPSPSVPTDRLIKNIAAYLKENPDDAQGHYLLARVHYMAFVNRLDHVRANDPGSEKKLPRLTDPRQYGKAEGEKIKLDKALGHARGAIRGFRVAINMDKDNALYHLGLASILEQAANTGEKLGPPDTLKPKNYGPEDKKPDYTKLYAREAVKSYLAAYKLDREAALKKRSVFLPFYPVAYEAGKAYLTLLKVHELKPADDKIVGQIKEDMEAIDGKPKAITPIIFRADGTAPKSLNDLITKGKTVRFDLDADGVAERRPWVRPDTAILVWDPDNTGKINNGQQLFGNMTFRMLFSDGYQALDSLDDNRDGKLAGSELKGLALWHDRNTNGVSDPGEVTPINKTRVVSIATGTTGKVNGLHPMNHAGITMSDGSARPTWDWVIPAVPESSAGSGEAGR